MLDLYYDAVIVGAGFGGIYQLRRLLKMGLSAFVIDQAGDVGGTWYWNRYPGAMSDTESYIYRFSWDKEDLQQYHWKDHYVKQPEVLAYLEHVVDRHDLRKHMQFNTQLTSAEWDDDLRVWKISTSTEHTFTARYLITALGLLSKQNYPDIAGIETFRGELYHTGRWPTHYDFKNKRVGVIGNGSTGVQVMTAIAKEVKQLVSFQRHPQYSVPSGDGPVDSEYRDRINANYDQIWDQVMDSNVAFGFEESTVPAMSVSEAERNRKYQEAWDRGNGFRFMFWTFSDLTTNPEANETACKFIRNKISEIVKDPEKARKLTPHDHYARRPLCDAGYYEQFNRDTVDIVSLQETPITAITPTGIQTSDNTHHDLDVIIFATGFDAVDGNYTRVAIQGRDHETLKDHWSPHGPTTYLGVCVPGFPNLFMISGPNGPFSNIPPALETTVDFISDTVARAERGGADPKIVEALPEAEAGWTALCDDTSKDSLFKTTPSWIFGANVPGKRHSSLFYFGGLRAYRERLREVVNNGYVGFKPF